MPVMDNNEQNFQRLRLRRFYMAQINYLISHSIVAVAWFADQFHGSGQMALLIILAGSCTQALFWWSMRSGYNLRFADPSMTSAQIVVALLLASWLLLYLGDFRGTVLLLYPVILLFGVFQLNRRQFITHAILALLCFSAVVLHDLFRRPENINPTLSILQLFVLCCVLGWLSIFGSYIRELRERLQRRHSTLQAHQETLKGMMSQLQTLATSDSLTGLSNRRHFMDVASRRLALLGPGEKLGLALIDLDHFKRINDLYGHAAGDTVLQTFARIARKRLRDEDLIARFGGEEFILLLGNASIDSLTQCIERLRQAFAECHFDSMPEGTRCSFSAGLTLLNPGDPLEVRINEADQALYQAKDNGRNSLQIHPQAV